MATFPELAENDHAKVTKLDEEWMKSEAGKKSWRDFITRCVPLPLLRCACSDDVVERGFFAGRYEKKVKDYNFGSLIRTDARQEYSETNTIFVTRIQVCARLLYPAVPSILASLLLSSSTCHSSFMRVSGGRADQVAYYV